LPARKSLITERRDESTTSATSGKGRACKGQKDPYPSTVVVEHVAHRSHGGDGCAS
ncbi:MAG: hypothetical protein QOH33_1882, partial [Paraburkholderia sp.]|nr:hypothetical protein [Paraburkholderia sp.]